MRSSVHPASNKTKTAANDARWTCTKLVITVATLSDLLLGSMTIATKTLAGQASVLMALETHVAGVIMPGPFRLEPTKVPGMNRVIRSNQTVAVPVASGAGAGGIGRVVTGGTDFDIGFGRTFVIDPPGARRVIQWHAPSLFVAVVTEILAIVATVAIGRFALGVKTMRKVIVQLVNLAAQVVTPMAIYTRPFLIMTRAAPVRFYRRPVTMLVAPALRVNIG